MVSFLRRQAHHLVIRCLDEFKQSKHSLVMEAVSPLWLSFLFFFFGFLPFLGLLPQHMEVPRLEVKSEL